MEYQHLATRRKLNGSAALSADESVALAVRYQGTQASATITVSSGDITFKVGTAGAEAVDSTVGVAGVVADGTYTTLGAMVDAINVSPNWHAEIVDGLRADVSTAALKTMSEYTLAPTRIEVKNLVFDTSAFLSLSYRISARRSNFARTQKGCVSILEEVKALVNVGSGTLTLNVYEIDTVSGASTLRATAAGTDNSELSLSFASGNSDVRSEAGKDLLVRYTCSVDLPDTGAYLRVNGHVLV